MARQIPREWISWYPTIDWDKCIGCQTCIDFCNNGVFEWDDQNSHPIVANPLDCVVGCNACAKLCDEEAISFPTKEELNASIQQAAERSKVQLKTGS